MENHILSEKPLSDRPTISVIVPVYRVEKYLDKCVNSIVNQTYKNLEILLVDDGSPDCCGSMCDKWAIKDSRIQVIHKKNGGLSEARNIAISKASGRYIGFVDSDDYIEPDMYELLLRTLLESKADVSSCYALDEPEAKPFCSKRGRRYVTLKDCEAVRDLFVSNQYLRHAAWNKLYKKEIFDEIRFPVGRIYEDSGVMYKIMDRINKVACLDAYLYHYVQREDSIIHSAYNSQKITDRLFYGKEAMTYFKTREDMQKAAYCWNAKVFPDLWEIAYINGDRGACDDIIIAFRDMTKIGFFLSLNRKIRTSIFLVSPLLYYRVRRLWRCYVHQD